MDEWDVIEEFSRRRIRQFAVTIPLALLLGAGFIAMKSGSRRGGTQWSTPLAVAFALVALGLVAFSLWNWRCPKCRRYLGRGWAPRYCPGCGVQLQQ